jgi:hypothetical protein
MAAHPAAVGRRRRWSAALALVAALLAATRGAAQSPAPTTSPTRSASPTPNQLTVPTSWNALSRGILNATLTASAAVGNDLIVAGANFSVGGCANLARYPNVANSTFWFATGLGTGVDGDVTAMVALPAASAAALPRLLLAGSFSVCNGVAVSGVAVLNTSSGACGPLSATAGGSSVGTVLSLVLGPARSASTMLPGTALAVYACGNFTALEGASVGSARVATFDAVAGQWVPVGSGLPAGTVWSVAVFGGALYAGGNFSAASQPLWVLEAGAASWAAVPTGVYSFPTGTTVTALGATAGYLYVGTDA